MEYLDSLITESSGNVVKVGDTVLLRAENSEDQPYVALVENIISRGLNPVEVRVRWYYRPEETICGRRDFHGQKELFLSDHFDIQSADTVLDTCTVHSFDVYTKLESVAATDYYCRFAYEAAIGNFSPETVRVHCICEMPYNPDVVMLKCEGERCGEWFHLECMNLTKEEAKELEHFYCPDCQTTMT